jgi:alpha-galactosidase
LQTKIHARYTLGDTRVVYLKDEDTGRIGLTIYPESMVKAVVPRRETLAGLPEIDAQPAGTSPPRAWNLDSLVQLHLRGDTANGGFSTGRSMRNSASVDRFIFEKQEVSRSRSEVCVITTLKSAERYICKHHLAWERGDKGLRAHTIFSNDSDAPVTLEMLASFSLGGLTPFAPDDAPRRLTLHRFRSAWAGEGRLESLPLERLQMERSWAGHGVVNERFGQVGSMPVRGFFPFIALEDQQANVIWGAQLAWAGSWQMEAWRRDDTVCISGGLADREFGHWFKTVLPGESFASPVAQLAVGRGDLDQFCDRLTSLQAAALETVPSVENEMPIVCNEFCTTWGTPSEPNLLRIVRRIRDTPIRYLVIDAGWYQPDAGNWSDSHGDWIPSKALFPEGLASTVAKIRETGLIPGLWFEMETCGRRATGFSLADHLLKLDGQLLTVGERRF